MARGLACELAPQDQESLRLKTVWAMNFGSRVATYAAGSGAFGYSGMQIGQGFKPRWRADCSLSALRSHLLGRWAEV